jgi:hypothetical protein
MTDTQSQNSVSQKLKQALDKKLLSGGTLYAIDLLKEAHQEAQGLTAPWPQITAYRLAHLYMRLGRKTNWKEVDQLLDEASGDNNILGAMPLIYRLVSLQKLQHREPNLRDELQRVYKEAVARKKDHLPLPATRDQGYLVQPCVVNLLELAAYFIGLEYQPLEGQIDLSNDLFADLGVGRSAWYVLDSENSEEIAYPESIARQMFMQRRKEFGACLAIEYSGGRYAKACLPNGEYKERCFKFLETDEWWKRLKGESRRQTYTEKDHEKARQRKGRFLKTLENLSLSTGIDEKKIDTWWQNRSQFSFLPSDLPIIMLRTIPKPK